MSLSENGNVGMYMPVGPTNGYNGGMFGGEQGFFWYFIIFFFFMMFGNNGWGNGYGGGQGTVNQVNNDIQRGFDQAAISRSFTDQNASMQALASSLQNCCCENRLGTADLKYTIATEACADRQSVNDALRDLEMQNNLNTQAITGAINNGIQGIFDKMCQLELDSYKTKVSDLQTQLNISALKESQTAQTAQVLADNAAQTATLRNALNPTPVPAYFVPNPNGCNCGQNFYGNCGC